MPIDDDNLTTRHAWCLFGACPAPCHLYCSGCEMSQMFHTWEIFKYFSHDLFVRGCDQFDLPGWKFVSHNSFFKFFTRKKAAFWAFFLLFSASVLSRPPGPPLVPEVFTPSVWSRQPGTPLVPNNMIVWGRPWLVSRKGKGIDLLFFFEPIK